MLTLTLSITLIYNVIGAPVLQPPKTGGKVRVTLEVRATVRG